MQLISIYESKVEGIWRSIYLIIVQSIGMKMS